MLCDKTLRLIPNTRIASKRLLLEILKSDEVRSQIKGFANGTGGAMKNISQSSIRSIQIPLLDHEFQMKMHNVLSAISSAHSSLDEHLVTASRTFVVLRDHLLKGIGHAE